MSVLHLNESEFNAKIPASSLAMASTPALAGQALAGTCAMIWT